MKRRLLTMIAVLLALAVFSGCQNEHSSGTGSPDIGEPNTSAPAQPSESAEQVELDWAAVDSEIGVLTVRLPVVEGSYYSWKWEIEDESLVEFLTSNKENGEYTANFRALAEGECTIRFLYSCGDAIAERCVLRVRVAAGKITEIISGECVTVEGVRETVSQPEVMELHAANRIERILAQYHTMTAVSEFWDVENGEEIWGGKFIEQYDMSSGSLVYDDETEYAGIGKLFCSYREQGELFNVYCTYDEIKDETYALLIDAANGSNLIRGLWLSREDQCAEMVVSIEENIELNVRVMSTCWDNEVTGCREEYDYFIDLDTGLLEGIEKRLFKLGTDDMIYVMRTNVFYDDYSKLEARAFRNVVDTEDSCRVTFVLDPGGDNERSHAVSFKRHTEVSWFAPQEYVMYADAACTQKLHTVDTSYDEVTVYCSAEK